MAVATEIVVDAERRLGVMLAEMEKHPPGPDKKDRFHHGTDLPPTLSDLGISKQLSHRWQDAARVPEET